MWKPEDLCFSFFYKFVGSNLPVCCMFCYVFVLCFTFLGATEIETDCIGNVDKTL